MELLKGRTYLIIQAACMLFLFVFTTNSFAQKLNVKKQFGNGYRLTGDTAYRSVIIQSAKTLKPQ